MAENSIDRILESRKQAEQPASAEDNGDKFFSVLVGEANQEHFLELQFRIGMRTCFSYTDLLWFNHDPDSGCLDLEFGGYLVTVKGRGLYPGLFNSIKNKRVAWVKEADTEMQDHKENAVFVEEITVTPPSSGEGEESKEETKRG